MSTHDGHRQRLRERFLQHGLENFHDLNVLELLLTFTIPRKDTNALAHALLERFGSLEGVLSASARQLEEVPGIGENSAALLTLIPQIHKRCAINSQGKIQSITTVLEAGEYLVPRLSYEAVEKVLLLCLDSMGRVVACEELARGAVNAVSLTLRLAVQAAIRNCAAAVILAHNHPKGVALPSAEDKSFTAQAEKAFALVDIPLLDHIVVAEGDFVSFLESGWLYGRKAKEDYVN